MTGLPRHFTRGGALPVLLAAPVWLALLLAVAMPRHRLEWLALLLLAATVMTLAGALWRRGAQWPVAPSSSCHRRNARGLLLLLVAAVVAIALPLPLGLLMLAAARLLWSWRCRLAVGFPMIDAALVMAAVLALPR